MLFGGAICFAPPNTPAYWPLAMFAQKRAFGAAKTIQIDMDEHQRHIRWMVLKER